MARAALVLSAALAPLASHAALESQWEVSLGQGGIARPPALAPDGTIYVGGVTGDSATLLAVGPDGTLRWTFPVGGVPVATPAVGSDSRVYVGDYIGTFWAVNPDGTEAWRFAAGDRIFSSAAVDSAGKLYFGANDGRLYALNADGSLRWSFLTGGEIWSSPAVAADGTIVFGSADGRVYSLRPDGSERWRFVAGGAVRSAPALGEDGTIYATSENGRLYALTAAGTVRWTAREPDGFEYSSPVLGGEGVLYAVSAGRLGAWDSAGTSLWEVVESGFRGGPPSAAADGRVFVRGPGYRLRAFDPAGVVVDELVFGGGYSGVLLTGDGRLLATTDDGWLVCYTNAPSPAASSWPQFRRHPRRSGTLEPVPAVNLILPEAGMTFRAGQPVPLWASLAQFGPDAASDFLVDDVAVATTQAPFRGTWTPNASGVRSVSARARDSAGNTATSPTVAVNVLPSGANASPLVRVETPADGATLVTAPRLEVRAAANDPDGAVLRLEYFADGTRFAETEYPANTAAWTGFASGAHELLVVATDNAGGRSTSTVNRVTVTVRPWSLTFRDGIRSAQAAGPEGTLYVVTAAGALHALTPSGTTNWVFATEEGNITAAPAVAPDGTIYVATYVGRLHAVAPNGTPRWAFNAGQRIWSSPAIGPDGTVHFGCESRRFYAVRPDGTEKWRFEADGYVASAPAIAADGTVYFGSYGGAFYALNPDGTLQWQFAVPGVNSSPALGADGTVYFGAANNGDVYALWPEGTLRWKVSLPGVIGGASPTLAPDGTVFIASGHRVSALAGEDGAVRWSFVTRAEVMATPVVAADGTVLFGAMDRRFYALEPGGQVRWELALDGKVSEPALLTASGLLVFPTDDNRLHAVALGQPPVASPWPQFHRHPTRTGLGQARPAVRLVQPAPDTDFLVGDVVPLTAEASSANGAVTQVEFLAGTTVLGVATAGPPYQLSWAAHRVGEVVLRARATDVAGASARSAEVPIWVVDPAAPPVISESPQNVTVTNGMTVTLRVRAHGVPPLEYQWFRDGAALPGATMSELTFTNPTPADSARYRVEVRNVRGTAGSSPALVTVLAPPQLRWLTRGSSPSRHAPAIGRGGLIFHGSQSRWFTGIDPRGAFEWDYVADDEIWSAAALADDGTVYFGARDRHLYALHPDGGLRWRFATSYAVDASPALAADGTIYCASADGVVLAVSPEGIERWRFQAAGEIYSSPVVGADGTVFVISFGEPIPATETFSGRLYALRPDGSARWEYVLNERVAGSPAIGADGALYFGTPSGRFLAVNPDGTLRWQLATGGAFLENEPVIGSDGVLLIGQETGRPGTGATSGRFLAIHPGGTLRWTYVTPAPIYSTAAVTADGTVYFTDESQTFYALNANGTLRFTYPGSFVRGTSPALGYDGTIYLAQTTPHDLHALLGHSPPADSPWPMPRRDARHTANAGLPRGGEAWFYPFNSNAFDEEVRAIAVDGTNVFVGGTFKLAGGLPARYVARWDGERWSPLGEGMDGPVNALAVFQGQLHAGGEFTQADGAVARHLARWNGSRWEAVGAGLDDHVMALMGWGDSLVVGGSFRNAGNVPAQNIARWDGAAWHAFGDGVGAAVQALASDGTRLFVGGANLLDYGGQSLGVVARWDGQTWSRVGMVGPQGQVRALQWHQGRLYAAGDFQFADNRPARGIAVDDGTGWAEVGGGLSDPLFPYGYALASDGTSLWLGGTFTRAGSTGASRIARWDGTQWHALGAGVERRSGTSAAVVRALAIRDDEVFVGGTFLEADGNRTIRQFARWRSGAWASLGPAVGFVDGRFVLTLQTDRGLTYGIEASDDLRTWTRLVTFTNLTEAVRFADQRSATEVRRFYRAVSP